MGQITATRNLVAIKVVRHAGQKQSCELLALCEGIPFMTDGSSHKNTSIAESVYMSCHHDVPLSINFAQYNLSNMNMHRLNFPSLTHWG